MEVNSKLSLPFLLHMGLKMDALVPKYRTKCRVERLNDY